MGNFDLLSAVQPTGGWIAILGIKKPQLPWQELVQTREEAERVKDRYLKAGRDVYFGVAKFGDPAKAPLDPKTGKRLERGKENVFMVGSMWADIDCGEGKPYADKADGAKALMLATTALKLPTPILIDSGRGLHAYWPLTEAVTREEWEPVSLGLRDSLRAKGLQVDGVCFEVARVLRWPGTMNFKDDPPQPVMVLNASHSRTSLATMAALVGTVQPVASNATPTAPLFGGPRRPRSALMQQIVDSSDTEFRKIIARADPCKQLVACIEDRATLEEPRWRAALSVAAVCSDRDLAFDAVSKEHRDYDPDETRRKAALTKGPQSCKHFESLNPAGCKGCPHWGKLTSPVQLGRIIIEEEAPPVEEDEDTGEVIQIPKPPYGYIRDRSGAIWRKAAKDDEDDKLVYETNIYVTERLRDGQDGYGFVTRVHTKQDGIVEFFTSASLTGKGNEFHAHLGKNGIVLKKSGFALLSDYLIASYKQLEQGRKVTSMRNQFGWADNNKAFVVGGMEYRADGSVKQAPLAPGAAEIAKFVHSKGTFEKWKEVFNLYGLPGMEGLAFAAGAAFGSPLLHMSGLTGALINLVHNSSGTGKTTGLRMGQSVWGDPMLLMSKKEDTLLAKLHKMGILNSLPIGYDELTNIEPKDLSDLTYCVTHGSGRDRMSSSANVMRTNYTRWCTIGVCSSNKSFYEILEGGKGSPQGEMKRILEYDVGYNSVIDAATGRDMFDNQLNNNYGHAGPIYAAYVVTHYDEVMNHWKQIQERLDSEAGTHPSERYWSAVTSAIVAGISVAKYLKLHDWDMKRIFAWACNLIVSLRDTTTPPPDYEIQILRDFIYENTPHLLIVESAKHVRGNMNMAQLPTHEPRSQDVRVRYEPDTGVVYIAPKTFNQMCVTRSLNRKAILKVLEQKGIYQGTKLTLMTKGCQYESTTIRALVFDGKHSELDMRAVASKAKEESEAPEEADESSGSEL